MKKHAANLITLLRIFGVSFIFIWTPFKTATSQQTVLLLYIFLACTDSLDGWLARSRWGTITNLGTLLDPLADKLLILVYLPLLEMQQISSFPVFVLLGRDFAVTSLRIFAIRQGEVMSAKLTGKLRTLISFPFAAILFCRVKVGSGGNQVISLIVGWVQSWPQWLISGLIWLLVAVTIISLIEYFGSFFSRKGNFEALLN